MRHCCTADLAATSETEIKAFLTHLAVVGDVTAGTQNQAKSALLFLFRMVLGRELGFLDVPRAGKPERLPIVLSRQEIERLYGQFICVSRISVSTTARSSSARARATRTGSPCSRTSPETCCRRRWLPFAISIVSTSRTDRGRSSCPTP